MKKVGFIGTGGMGGPMAAHLLSAGFTLAVFDTSRKAVISLENKGATYVPSPRQIAETSDVVLSMLPFGETVREVVLGRGGLASAASGARVWIDLSSVEQEAVVETAKPLQDKGWTVLDASVEGVEEHAADREIYIHVSGEEAAVERVRPLLEAMGKKVTYCGALGSAKLVKTGIAMHAAVHAMATVEVFNWLRACGVSDEVTREVFRDSLVWSAEMERHCARIVDKKFKPRKSWMPKDIGFGLDNAQRNGVPLPFTSLARQLFNIGRSNGVDGFEQVGIAYKVYEILGQGEGGKK